MGNTVDEVLLNAEEALRDYATETDRDGEKIEIPSPFKSIETLNGNQLVSIPLIRPSSKSVRAG